MSVLLQARIRENDTLIMEHFQSVKKGDYSYEVRRLLEKAILIEQSEEKKKKENDM